MEACYFVRWKSSGLSSSVATPSPLSVYLIFFHALLLLGVLLVFLKASSSRQHSTKAPPVQLPPSPFRSFLFLGDSLFPPLPWKTPPFSPLYFSASRCLHVPRPTKRLVDSQASSSSRSPCFLPPKGRPTSVVFPCRTSIPFCFHVTLPCPHQRTQDLLSIFTRRLNTPHLTSLDLSVYLAVITPSQLRTHCRSVRQPPPPL